VIILKKGIIFLFIISLILLFSSKEKDILIPGNAIRFRVIANSNSLEDQNKKKIIKSEIEQEIYKLISNSDKSEIKDIINDNMEKIDEIVKSFNVPYQINYGLNYFPSKNYKGVLYQAGNYESLVITLGEGLGANFWCVLFPPLCLLDNETEDVSEVEYKFYVKKILDEF
jgi:stage II sporulation protein R